MSIDQRRVALAEAFRIATGKEPPVISPEEKAEYAEKRKAAWADARRIYGNDALG
jgi:hypothetical protein